MVARKKNKRWKDINYVFVVCKEKKRDHWSKYNEGSVRTLANLTDQKIVGTCQSSHA
jgi:hypothetical protein